MSLAGMIDHTILQPTTLISQVEQVCQEAIKYQFASVCVPPNFVKIAHQALAGSSVKTCTVIGFPFGYAAVEAKIAECILAMVDGAQELDVVANISAIKNADWQYLANEISHIMPVVKSKQAILKVIIESGVLTDEEIIKCCELYGVAGIDYLKTSTGFNGPGASKHAVQLFKKHLPSNVLIKASGGIRNRATAEAMVAAGASRLGCSASVAIVTDATTANNNSNY
jgi:deoxyribose-phosphate aldolase